MVNSFSLLNPLSAVKNEGLEILYVEWLVIAVCVCVCVCVCVFYSSFSNDRLVNL